MMRRSLSTKQISWEDACEVLVGGVNSPARAFGQVGGPPLMLARSHGAEVVDTDGKTYLDWIMGWGPLILGHSPEPVVRALRQRLEQGSLLGLTHPEEIELAELIREAVDSVEQVRFTVSGTEACLTAVRLARAATGRQKILAIDGGYHGHGESFLASSAGTGVSAALAQDVLRVPWNDPSAFDAVVEREARHLAGVIVEPVAANMGVIPPEPGYLERLRAATKTLGIVLIFDEVVTGFRLGIGGAQRWFGIPADLTVLGKILGGGLPIGAVAGPRALMRHLSPEGNVFHGGTFAGHPLCMAAGCATLEELRRQPPYERIERLTDRLVTGLRERAGQAGVPVQINAVGSMFTVFFADHPVRNVRDARACRTDRFVRWIHLLREHGILVPPSPMEALFVSAAHTDEHVDQFLAAAGPILQAAARC